MSEKVFALCSTQLSLNSWSMLPNVECKVLSIVTLHTPLPASGYPLPSIIRPWIIYRLHLRRPSNQLLQLPLLDLRNPLIHRLLRPQRNRKMTKRSHSDIHPPSRSDPSLSSIRIASHPSLIKHDFSVLHILQTDRFFFGLFETSQNGSGGAFGTKAHLGNCMVDVFVCYLPT